MGNSSPPPKKKEPTLDEIVLDLKMASKRFQSESNRAMKDKEKQMNKAKDAIKKGNDESAKLYLANAAQKQNESMSLLRMAHKMDALTCTVRNNTSSTTMMAQLNKLVPALNMTTQQFPIEKMYDDMLKFENSMDQIIVATNTVDNVINRNQTDINQNGAIDQMLHQLKQENYNELRNDVNANNNILFQELQNPEQMQNMANRNNVVIGHK